MFLLIWPIMALVVAWIASNKGHSFLGWFIYGLFLWPVALIHVFFIGNQSKKCPECFSKVDSRASTCPSCKHKFSSEELKTEVQKKEKSQNQKAMLVVGVIVVIVLMGQFFKQFGTNSNNSASNASTPSPTPIADDAWITDMAQKYYKSHITMKWGKDQFYGGTLTQATAKHLMSDCIDELKSKDNCQGIVDKKFWIGLTDVWVTMSMGNPNDVNNTVVGNLTEAQWIYGNPIYGATYLYFYNGILKSYQN